MNHDHNWMRDMHPSLDAPRPSVPAIRRQIIPRWQRWLEEFTAIALAGVVFVLASAAVFAALVFSERMFGNIFTW